MPIDTTPVARFYDGTPLVLMDAQGNPLPFPPSSLGQPALHIKDPRYPDLRFEWHPGVEKLYVVPLNREPLMGHMVASQVDTHGKATTAMWIFLRGLRWDREQANTVLAE